MQAVWNAPEPWAASDIDGGDNQKLPQFPPGTQVALLRLMTLFDHNGTLASTPIVESLQIRVYRTITSRQDINRVDFDWPIAGAEQDFHEIRLSQAQMFAGHAGGLRAVAREATELATFQTHGVDSFEISAKDHTPVERGGLILGRCVACHSAPGIHSVQIRAHLLTPNRAQFDPEHGNDPDKVRYGRWWEYGDNLPWKEARFDWGLLNGYWVAKPEVMH